MFTYKSRGRDSGQRTVYKKVLHREGVEKNEEKADSGFHWGYKHTMQNVRNRHPFWHEYLSGSPLSSMPRKRGENKAYASSSGGQYFMDGAQKYINKIVIVSLDEPV